MPRNDLKTLTITDMLGPIFIVPEQETDGLRPTGNKRNQQELGDRAVWLVVYYTEAEDYYEEGDNPVVTAMLILREECNPVFWDLIAPGVLSSERLFGALKLYDAARLEVARMDLVVSDRYRRVADQFTDGVRAKFETKINLDNPDWEQVEWLRLYAVGMLTKAEAKLDANTPKGHERPGNRRRHRKPTKV